ncbi:MAG: hypothetical protein ACYC5O_10325 [Anaerolineae bacterium]
MDLTVAHVQGVVFFHFPGPVRWVDVGKVMGDATVGVLDGEPAVIPFGDDAPSAIPRCILQTPDQSWSVQVGPERASVSRVIGDRATELDLAAVAQPCFQVLYSLWQGLRQCLGATGTRLGFACGYACPVPDPVGVLRGRFLPHSTARKQHELHLHALHRVGLADGQGTVVNRWLRCSGVAAPGEGLPPLTVAVDINTLPETPHATDEESIARFFGLASVEASRLVAAAFGGESPSEEIF